MKNLLPGTIVAVNFGLYEHVGIVTDQFHDGMPMVISNSYRKGGVFEEPWNDFTCHQEVIVRDYPGRLSADSVLIRARSRIGSRWNLLHWNCEHFVFWAHGLKAHSPQLISMFTCISVIAGISLVYRFSRELKS